MFRILSIFGLLAMAAIFPPFALIAVPVFLIWLFKMCDRAKYVCASREAYVSEQELATRRKAAAVFR